MKIKDREKDVERLNQRHGFGGWCAAAKREMDQDKLGWLFLVVTVGALIMISVYYWEHYYQLVNDDIAGEHLYSKMIWDTGDPFFPGFANNKEVFISRPWPVFLIAYALVKNIALASRIEVIVSLWLLILSAMFFFRKLKWSWPAVLLAAVSFWGLMSDDGGSGVRLFLIPSDSFVNFCMGIFLTVGMFMDIAENRGKKSRTVKSILLYGLACYFGLCGVRMSIYLYIPLVAAMVLKWISGTLNGKGFMPDQKNKMFHSILLLVVYLAALLVNRAVICPYMHGIKFSLAMASFGVIWDRFRHTFMCLLRALDIVFSGGSPVSPRAILTLYKIALVGVLVWSGLFLSKAGAYKEGEKEALMLLLLTVGELMFIFTFTTDDGFPGRFFTVPMAVALMVGISYNYLRSHVDMKLLGGGFCLFILAGICLSLKLTYPKWPSSDESPSALMQLTQYLEDTGRDRIAGHYWNVTTPVFFSEWEITGMTLWEDDALQPSDWIVDRTSYANDDEPVTLILTKAQKDVWEQSARRSHLLSIADGTDEAFGYYLYDFDENPFAFDLYSGMDYGLDIRCNFLTLLYSEGAALDDGSIVLHPGEAQYGPYKALKAGAYDVTVRGEGLENGTYDVVSELGAVSYEMENMKVLPDQVTYTVHLDGDVPNIEFRCVNDSSETVSIKDITITPWDMKAIWE